MTALNSSPPVLGKADWVHKAENTNLLNSSNVFLALSGKGVPHSNDKNFSVMSVLLFKRSWILVHAWNGYTPQINWRFHQWLQWRTNSIHSLWSLGEAWQELLQEPGDFWRALDSRHSRWDSAATALHVWWQPGDGVCVLWTRLLRGAQCCGHTSVVCLESKDNCPRVLFCLRSFLGGLRPLCQHRGLEGLSVCPSFSHLVCSANICVCA